MDLSEIPHAEWDYSVLQLAHLNSSEEGGEDNSIYENKIPEVEFLYQPLQSILGGSDAVCTSLAVDRFSGIDSYWNSHSAGYDMIVANERSVSNCLVKDMCQLEWEQENTMQLTLEYCPEFSDSTTLQEFGISGATSNSALVVANTPWENPQIEGSFQDDIFRISTSDPNYSLNEWLTYFATAGGNSPDIPGLVCGQNDISFWIPPSDECSSDPPLALTDGPYAGEIDPDLLCTKEEEESTLGSGKKKRKSGSPTREGTQIVKRRGKRSSFSEEEGESGRRSQRVHRAPLRYIDEVWCKPKEKRKYKSRKAFMPLVQKSIVSPESNMLQTGTQESLVWWWGPEVSEPSMAESNYVETQKLL